MRWEDLGCSDSSARELPPPPVASLGSMSSHELLELEVRLGSGQRGVVALVDSGATHNFLQDDVARRCTLVDVPQAQRLRVKLADGRVVQASRVVEGPVEFAPGVVLTGRFQVAPIHMECILGMPWLQQVSPHIDWKMGCIHWEHGDVLVQVWGRGRRAAHLAALEEMLATAAAAPGVDGTVGTG